MSGLESYLVALSLAVLKYYAAKGGSSVEEYIKERLEVKGNESKADKYTEVVNKPGNTREERKDAENSALG